MSRETGIWNGPLWARRLRRGDLGQGGLRIAAVLFLAACGGDASDCGTASGPVAPAVSD